MRTRGRVRFRTSFWQEIPLQGEEDVILWCIKVLNGSWVSILLLPPVALFSILLPFKLDGHLALSWYFIFSPLWIFNILLAARSFANLYAFYFYPSDLGAQIPFQSVFSSSQRHPKSNFVVRILLIYDSHLWRAFNGLICSCWLALGFLFPVFLESPGAVKPSLLFVLFIASATGVIYMSSIMERPQRGTSEFSESESEVFRASRHRPSCTAKERCIMILFMVATMMTGFLWWLRLDKIAEPSYLVIFMPLLAAHLVFIITHNPTRSRMVPDEFRSDFNVLTVSIAVVLITFQVLLIERLTNENSAVSFTVAFIPLFLLSFSLILFGMASCVFQIFLHLFPNWTNSLIGL